MRLLQSLSILSFFAVSVVFLAQVCDAVFKDLRLVPDNEHAPFLHGVASADPFKDSVLLWTRVTDPTVSTINWAIWDPSQSAQNFDNPVQQGTVSLSAETDFTVVVEASGLLPGTRYAYQFEDPSGRKSALGRTKTASPEGNVRAAIMSCTSLWSGYFNFYKHVAQDDKLDFVLHLGDYIYPEIDRDEPNRIPSGLCEYDWFREFHSVGMPSDNTDPFLQGHVESLNCSESDLHMYRWVYGLYHLDPDLRAARAAHPFIVTLDNHELNGRTSSNDGSRRAASEWVAMRSRLDKRKDGTEFINSLRSFRFGADLLDVVALDTYTFVNDTDREGLLGEAQHVWLDSVLANSTQVKWRMFATTKEFMPFVLNDLSSGFNIISLVLVIAFAILLGSCVFTERFLHARRLQKLSPAQDDQKEEGMLMISEQEDDGVQRCGEWRKRISNQRAAFSSAHQSAPRVLRYCTCIGVCWLVLLFLVWISGAIALNHILFPQDKLALLHAGDDTWDGNPASRDRLFDQLETTGTANNNFFASGDMHMSVAADVFRFDANGLDLLDYDKDDETMKRYGVEMLPTSGSRGNLDEKLLEVTGFLKPHSVLSNVVQFFANFMIQMGNAHFEFFQGQDHGYGVVEVSETQIEASFLYFDIRQVSDAFVVGKKLVVRDGMNRWDPGA